MTIFAYFQNQNMLTTIRGRMGPKCLKMCLRNIWMVPCLIQKKNKELHVRCAIVLYTSNFFYVDQL